MNYRRTMLIAMQYVYGILGISSSILIHKATSWEFSITSFQTVLSFTVLGACGLAIIALRGTVKEDERTK